MVTAAEARDNWRATNPDKRAAQRLRAREAEKKKREDPVYRENFYKARKENYHKTKGGKVAYYLWAGAKRRSTARGLDFDIEVSDIVIPEVCPVLLIPLVQHQGKANFDSPSLDRMDNSKGYIKGNIQVISKKANAMKLDASEEELRKFAIWIMRKDNETYDGSSIDRYLLP